MGQRRGETDEGGEGSMPGPRRGARKGELPAKPCLQCGRPMAWRRKWADHWDEVRYCSKRCAGEAKRERALARSRAAGARRTPSDPASPSTRRPPA